ncbi:MAG: ABC-F family ATP-binding cassette domain-containing protein [Aeriscardovia sp.]|nr:ABC-F family ATP-binding cassette domain-containing protein [Aeriscardovia sp.]
MEIKGLFVKRGGKEALKGASFSLPPSSLTVLLGRNGSGKTTLLKVLAGEEEKSGGEISLPPELKIASVPQEPASAMLGGCLREEMETWGAGDLEVFDVLAFLGISHLLDEPFSSLSAGQVEVCALAAALSRSPGLVLLDEPLSPLDPVSRRRAASLIASLNRELGISFLIAEHDLEPLLSLNPRVVALKEGKVLAEGGAKEALESLWAQGERGLVPDFQKLYLSQGLALPLSVKEAEKIPYSPKAAPLRRRPPFGEKALSASHLAFAWPGSPSLDVSDLSFDAFFGEALALVGENGSGKSTLLKLLAGPLRPRFGRIWRRDRKGGSFFLPQDPLPLLALKEGEELGKEEFLTGSRGEMQRAADLIALRSGKNVILLDEPARSLDGEAREEVGEEILKRAQEGALVVFSTHDPAFCASFSDRTLCLLKGKKAFLGGSRELVGGRAFFTTPFHRAFPNENVLTLKDCA